MNIFNLIFILLILFSGNLYSGSLTVKEGLKLTSNNNVYLSFFGDGNPVALNYERIFGIKKGSFLTFKTGISYHPDMTGAYIHTSLEFDRPDETGPIITYHLTYNYGKKYTFFEIGLGTSVYLLEDNDGYIVYPILGLRKQSSNGSFRVFTHPFSLIDDNVDWICPVGISFGFSF